MNSLGFQFPQDVIYALSSNYVKSSFNKNQVEQDLSKNKAAFEIQLDEIKSNHENNEQIEK